MIVPTTRAILLAAVVLPPSAALTAMAPNSAPLMIALVVGWLVVSVLDAYFATRMLSRFQFQWPSLVRLSRGREALVEVGIQWTQGRAQIIEIGCATPTLIDVVESIHTVRVPAEAGRSVLKWRCTGRERGRYFLREAVVGCSSRLGLWTWRATQKIETELRVYPDLSAERRQVAAIFLRRGLIGAHSQRGAGQGREFEKLREYLPGDSLSDVHWKASGKRTDLVTKVHQIERSHEVYVAIDASRLSGRHSPGDQPSTVLDRYVTSSLILAAAAERQGDQFGLMTFSDRVHTFLRARGGKGHFDVCRDRIYSLQPRMVTPDFAEACSFLRSRLRKRALIIFLTALDDPYLAESFLTAVQLINRQHLTIANMIRAAELRPIFENAEIESVDEIYRELGGHLQWKQLRQLERVLRLQGVRFELLEPGTISSRLVQQHAEVRSRELL